MEETQKQLSSAITHTNSKCSRVKVSVKYFVYLVTFLLSVKRLVELLKLNLSDVFECSNLKAGMVFISQPHLLLAIHKEFSA